MRLVLLGLIVLASAPLSARDKGPIGEDALAAEIGDRAPAPAVTCIDSHQVQSTRIIDGTAIVYDFGSRLYVNRPLIGASQLRSDDIPVTRISGGELCRIDSISLIDRASRMQRGFVVLGSFDVYGPRRRNPG